MDTENIVYQIKKRGVNIPHPESVFISNEINSERISTNNVTIHSGCKIFGKNTLIMDHVTLGYEAPVTMCNTFVGKGSKLHGGFFDTAVFAGNNTFGSGAHVRSGTILEENAKAAHAVGLKQTILFPYVTLGSLINFCDCFMSGGSDETRHSEVGSSFIHFNYTPNQDKATASMFGNVHEGVMLDTPPIFLGGQGGIVGPLRIAFGCTTAAGSIIRCDEERPNRLLFGGINRSVSMVKKPFIYKNVRKIFNRNIEYIAELVALLNWYAHVRSLFSKDDLKKALLNGMQDNVISAIDERCRRLKDFCFKLKESKNKSKAVALHDTAIHMYDTAYKQIHAAKKTMDKGRSGNRFVNIVKTRIRINGNDYIKVIKSLSQKEKNTGTQWLLEIKQNLAENLYI